jgi:hypothetical protein
LVLLETRRFKRVASDGSYCLDRDARCCRRGAGHDDGGLLPYAITPTPVGHVLRDGCACTETAKTV